MKRSFLDGVAPGRREEPLRALKALWTSSWQTTLKLVEEAKS